MVDLRSLTERELVSRLVDGYFRVSGGVTPEQVIEDAGDCLKTRSAIEFFETWRQDYENPEAYWNARIDILKQRIVEYEQKRAQRERPTRPYCF